MLERSRPFSVAEFGAAIERLARFETRPFLALAVSGGADSLALAILADRWAKERGGEVCAVTVDHGLRQESAQEIRRLGGWLGALGIRHEVLLWQGEKPLSGIEAKARRARYRLLSLWCRREGCLHLLTAHHRDDQRETHLIRRRAKSGPDGLAAMSGVREIDGCRLLRPFLATPKSRLVATLDALGQPFLCDPSNENPAFERARLRAFAAQGAGELREPHEGERLDAEISAFGRERQARAQALARLSARVAALHPAGFAALDAEGFFAAPRAEGEALLSALAAAVGGGDYEPRRERVSSLWRLLEARPKGARTLGGCRFLFWRGKLLVLRELALASPPRRLRPGEETRWDRRFAVALPREAPRSLLVGYLGQWGGAPVSLPAAKPGLPPLLHPVLPAFWDEEGRFLALPALDPRGEEKTALPRLFFRPPHPLSNAAFTVV